MNLSDRLEIWQNNYVTIVFETKKLRAFYLQQLLIRKKKCINGLKWDQTNEKALVFHTLFHHMYRILQSKCVNFHSKCQNLNRQRMKLHRKYIEFCIVFLKHNAARKKSAIAGCDGRDKYQLWIYVF